MTLDPNLSILDGGPKQYASSIWSRVEPSMVANKHRLAIISAHQEPHHLRKLVGEPGEVDEEDMLDCLALTYQQFLRGGLRLATGLQKAGVSVDSTMVSALPAGADFWIYWLSSWLLKVNVAPIDYGTLLEPRKDQLQHFISLLRPKVFVISDTAGAKAVDAAEKALGYQISVKITTDWDKKGPLDASWRTLESFYQDEDLSIEEALLHEARSDNYDRTAFTIFTSGTSSGHPKGCPRTVLSLLQNDNMYQRAWTEKPGRCLVDTANFRIIILVIAFTMWNEGSCLAMSGPTFKVPAYVAALSKYKITDTVSIVAMLRMLDAYPGYSPSDAATVRTNGAGGDVVTRSALELAKKLMPNCGTYVGTGMSEGGNFAGWDWNAPMRYFGEIGSAGTIRPGFRLKITDDEGHTVPRGTTGNFILEAKTMVQHYLDDVSPETFYSDDDGRWFRTGDIAVIDKDGYIFILGRSKDIIKRAGIPITPAALESCIQPYLDTEVAVFGIPDKIFGATPFAVVGTFRSKSPEDVKKHVVEIFGPDYALGGVASLEQLGLSAFPYNPSGKIQRLDLQNALKARPGLITGTA